MKRDLTLGLDIGSATLSYVLMNRNGTVLRSGYTFHQGRIQSKLMGFLRSWPVSEIHSVGVNDRGARFVDCGLVVNEQVAVLEGLSDPMAGGILYIGAEQFGLILLDSEGRYQKLVANSGCAAGTGSFLDQQASRLGLKNSASLSRIASKCAGELPLMATRCAVFTKTDLIHAQQRGFGIEAICSGLCMGVAKNVLDTVSRGRGLPESLIVCGGVALNKTVVGFIETMAGVPVRVSKDPHLTAARGAAILASRSERSRIRSVRNLFESRDQARGPSYYKPLDSLPYHVLGPEPWWSGDLQGVETELFKPLKRGMHLPASLGLDIGSTSTKAVLMGQEVIAAFYTRTQGRPIQSVQSLLRAIRFVEKKYGVRFEIESAGTTGSGRKLIHHLMNTDLAIDEITAHARSAAEILPEVDTILEIGGQDSKFTIVQDGRVVFSVMNFVCAAGTGSFLEEQAGRLGAGLEDYSGAETSSAPITSDRCTVFMERDLNVLLSQGLSRSSLLAAALHSVRDNYLTKVARVQRIGDHVVFQGATGRNRGLVKAFEQKLGKTITVSRFCHVAGAMGVCLILKERKIRLNPGYRASFLEESPVVHERVCMDCGNHCKLLEVERDSKKLTWGRLCGREEGTERSQEAVPDLLARREKLLTPARDHFARAQRIPILDQLSGMIQGKDVRIQDPAGPGPVRVDRLQQRRSACFGLPNTLNFMDMLPFWRSFFLMLGYRVRVSSSDEETMQLGKNLEAAEFCAPLANLHGHVRSLLDSCDFVFMPVTFGDRIEKNLKSYCYYSHYAAATLCNNLKFSSDRIIAPVWDASKPAWTQARTILDSLPASIRSGHTVTEITAALWKSAHWFEQRKRQIEKETAEFLNGRDGIAVVILGRPYLALDGILSNRVAQRVRKMGVPVLYQDMLSLQGMHPDRGKIYVEWNQWLYGERILTAAEQVADHSSLFPVYLTAFKCAPDSFLVPYVRDIWDRSGKPYLILQMDDHQSAEGMETRLESALETFRNSKPCSISWPPIEIPISRNLNNRKIYLIPNYDPIGTNLMAAAFRRHGIRAMPIEETDETVKASVRVNDGQCLPMSALIQGIRHTIRTHGLNPKNTAFFINALCQMACNFPQYPIAIKKMLDELGDGLENVEVFVTGLEMLDMPKASLLDIYHAYLLGGLLQKMACRVRPREIRTGDTESALLESVELLSRAIIRGDSKEAVFQDIVRNFEGIPQSKDEVLPQVAILGDMYVRDNHIFNQNLIREIEENGGEAVTTPYNFVARLTAGKHFSTLAQDRQFAALFFQKALLLALSHFDKRYYEMAYPVLREDLPDFDLDFKSIFERYHLTHRHGGETAQNVLKLMMLIQSHPQIVLFVHVNPVFCCPALVSESIFQRIEKEIGIPIVTIQYDGTQTPHNAVLKPFLHFHSKSKISVVS